MENDIGYNAAKTRSAVVDNFNELANSQYRGRYACLLLSMDKALGVMIARCRNIGLII